MCVEPHELNTPGGPKRIVIIRIPPRRIRLSALRLPMMRSAIFFLSLSFGSTTTSMYSATCVAGRKGRWVRAGKW